MLSNFVAARRQSMLPPRAMTMRLNSPGTQATDDILLPGW